MEDSPGVTEPGVVRYGRSTSALDAGRIAARLFAIVLLALVPFVWAQILWHQFTPAVVVQRVDGRYVVTSVSGSAAQRAGVRVGDEARVEGLSGGERYLLALGSLSRPVSYPLVRDGKVRTVVLPGQRVAWPSSWFAALDDLATAVAGTVTLIVGAILLWRRPSALTFAFGIYALGGVPAYTVIELFSYAPSAVLTAAVVVTFVLFGPIPQFALLSFAGRFPRTPRSTLGRLAMHGADLLALAAVILYAVRYSRVDAAVEPANVLKDLAPQVLAVVLASIVAAIRFSRSVGADRRRVGWVLCGLVISGASYCILNFDQDFVNIGFALPHWIGPFVALGYGVFPLTLTYAVLRHRVIDVGFALNRTLVFTVLTLLIVVVISAVDWLSGRFISNSNLSVIVEGLVTIAFGVTLNWFHGRVERAVDRIVFRKRHLAAKRLETRIRALDYATEAATVEDALVDEVVAVLELRSAAVFRRTDGESLVRARAVGWDGASQRLDSEQLLVRALRAEERTVFLDEDAIGVAAFPAGAARPDFAIPILVRHELVGLVLYGHRDSEAIVDPEERALLERLTRAAASAYDAIQAAEWRALALEAQGRAGAGT
jgi:GAF domain